VERKYRWVKPETTVLQIPLGNAPRACGHINLIKAYNPLPFSFYVPFEWAVSGYRAKDGCSEEESSG